jgi:serine/threonine protein kinase
MREARERGHFVRALVRNVQDPHVTNVAHETALLGDDESEKIALLGAHAVVSCLGVRDALNANDVDAAINLRIFERCLSSASTVRFIVFVSTALPALLRRSVPLVEARERVVDALSQQREIPFAIVRPSLLLDDLVDIYRDIDLGTAPSIGPAMARCNPIGASDVARVILHVLDNSRYYARRELHIGGPDIYCWAALADLVADIAGRTRVGSVDKPGVVQGMVRTLSLPFSSHRDTVSLLLRSKFRTANLDCIGAPVGLQSVRQFFIDKHIGQVLVDEDGVVDTAAPTDMPRIAGCSLLWNGDRAVACASVRLTTLTAVSPRILARLHTVKAAEGAVAPLAVASSVAAAAATVSSPARIPDEDANATGCFRFSLRIGRACRIRWQFIVDGRGAKRAVFRVLQHQPLSSLSAPSSRTPSRAGATGSAATTPRTSVVAVEPEIRHSTSELDVSVVRRRSSPTPVRAGALHDSSHRGVDAAALSVSTDADLLARVDSTFASSVSSDVDLLATSPQSMFSPVRRLAADFDAVAESSGMTTAAAMPQSTASEATMFDSASAQTSFKNLQRTATADLGALAERMRAGVAVKSRSYRLRSFDACFVGRDAVDWLIEQRVVQTRDTAVVLGEVLRKAAHFRSLQGATQFADDGLYYRFAVDEPAPAVMRTGLEDDDDDDAATAAAAAVAEEEALPLDLTTCLYRDDECLKFDLVEGECVLPTEGLYSLVWTSHVGRFALGRPLPPRLMYSIALFDGETDSDAVAHTSDAESGASTYRARSAFAAQLPRELSLADGELVWTTVRHGHWWRGRRASDGATGWFPAIAVERAASDAPALVDALVRNRCDPRTEGIDLLVLRSARNALNPRDAFRFPLVGFELRDEPIQEAFEPLARELHTKQLDSTAPERVDDLLCVAFRGAEPPQLRAESALMLADSDDLDLGAVMSFDSDAFASLVVTDSSARAVLSLAHTTADHSPYIVREVALARLGSAAARHSLLGEIATLRQLSSDWFARLVGVWRSNARTALVYAPMDGGILRSHIVRARAAPPLTDGLPLRHCLAILLCVVKAVSCAHSFGLVLRDLQADTVLLSDDPATASSLVQARLFDVSRARRWLGNAGKPKAPPTPTTTTTTTTAAAASQHQPASLVRLDVLRVSPPECVAWRKPFFEPLSDVWSFGCLMMELFSWHKVFEELDSEARVLNALRTGQRPDIGAVLPRYRGRRLLNVLESCLRPLPEPLVMLADPDSGRVTVSQLTGDLEQLLLESQK